MYYLLALMDIITLLVLGSGWCLAWLMWWFKSSLPGKVLKLFPKEWGLDIDGTEYIDDLEVKLAVSNTPMLLVQLIMCPYCLAAHFSAWVCVAEFIILLPMLGLPASIGYTVMLWGAQASVAIYLFNKHNTKPNE